MRYFPVGVLQKEKRHTFLLFLSRRHSYLCPGGPGLPRCPPHKGSSMGQGLCYFFLVSLALRELGIWYELPKYFWMSEISFVSSDVHEIPVSQHRPSDLTKPEWVIVLSNQRSPAGAPAVVVRPETGSVSWSWKSRANLVRSGVSGPMFVPLLSHQPWGPGEVLVTLWCVTQSPAPGYSSHYPRSWMCGRLMAFSGVPWVLALGPERTSFLRVTISS